MDDESLEIPVTQEKIEQIDDASGSSISKASISNSRQKILPHHLQASSGSCHDFCKYGHKHAFIEKRNHRRPKGANGTADEGKSTTVQDIPLANRKKEQVTKSKPSEAKAQVSDTPLTIIKRETKIVKQEALSPLKKANASNKSVTPAKGIKKELIKPRASTDSKIKVSERSKIKQEASLAPVKPNNAYNAIGMSLKPVAVKSHSKDSTGGRNGGIMKSRNSRIDQRKEIASPRLMVSLRPSLRRAGSLKTRDFKVLKSASALKKENKFKKAECPEHNEETVVEKVLYMIEPKPKNINLGSTGNASNSMLFSFSSSHSSSSLGSASAPSSPSSPGPKKNKKIVSKSAFVERINSASGKKIQKMKEIGSVKVESNPRSRRPTTHDHSASQYYKTGKKNQLEHPKEEHKHRPKRAQMVLPQDKDLSKTKSFRRGKAINLQPDSNGPWRLRFRKGRVIGDNQNVKGDTRRSFKQRVAGKIEISKMECEKVTLRHQDVNEKKDAQLGLFNNVIEETASKLVKMRKSKVKALVGAFETVISLQEGKSSSTTTN